MTMDRRTFLAQSSRYAVAASGALIAGCATTRDIQLSPESVVVIGAGVAGLSAARELQRLGNQVVVLEAQNRIGGRVQTDYSLGTPVEMGASRLNGVKKNPLVPLLDDAGVMYDTLEWGFLSGADNSGAPFDEERLSTTRPDLFKMAVRAYVRNVGKNEDQAVEDVIQRELDRANLNDTETQIWNFALTSGEIANASPFTKASWKMIREFEAYGGDVQMIVNGYDRLPSHLAQGLDIRTGIAVNRIEYDDQGVTISTSDGVISAGRAILTVSLGVLQQRGIEFFPELPEEKMVVIDRMGMGNVNKVVFKYPKVFWPEDKYAIVHGTKVRGEFCAFVNLARYSGAPILIAQLPESYHNALDGASDTEVFNEGHGILKKIFGNSIPDPIGKLRTQWGANPYTRGAFSYNKLGASPKDHETLSAPIENRLFFAGEATHRKKFGSVEGAYLSGVRVAKEIVNQRVFTST